MIQLIRFDLSGGRGPGYTSVYRLDSTKTNLTVRKLNPVRFSASLDLPGTNGEIDFGIDNPTVAGAVADLRFRLENIVAQLVEAEKIVPRQDF